MDKLARFRGCLLGLATGDALGTTVEFQEPGTFEPVLEITGGGVFHLEPGEWTDDTSMALCLAESLVERRGFDLSDQLERYAVFGQLAGAYYGACGIPERWLKRLAKHELIESLAVRLCLLSEDRAALSQSGCPGTLRQPQ